MNITMKQIEEFRDCTPAARAERVSAVQAVVFLMLEDRVDDAKRQSAPSGDAASVIAHLATAIRALT